MTHWYLIHTVLLCNAFSWEQPLQPRACLIQSPAKAISHTESRAPGVYLHIKSKQTFPWWGNHSSLECSLGQELSWLLPSYETPLMTQWWEEKLMRESEGKEHGTGAPNKMTLLAIPLSELDQEIHLIRAQEPLRNQGQGWVSEQGGKKRLCNKF